MPTRSWAPTASTARATAAPTPGPVDDVEDGVVVEGQFVDDAAQPGRRLAGQLDLDRDDDASRAAEPGVRDVGVGADPRPVEGAFALPRAPAVTFDAEAHERHRVQVGEQPEGWRVRAAVETDRPPPGASRPHDRRSVDEEPTLLDEAGPSPVLDDPAGAARTPGLRPAQEVGHDVEAHGGLVRDPAERLEVPRPTTRSARGVGREVAWTPAPPDASGGSVTGLAIPNGGDADATRM